MISRGESQSRLGRDRVFPGKKIDSLAAQPPDLIEFKPENQTPSPFQCCKCPINRYNIYYQYIIL